MLVVAGGMPKMVSGRVKVLGVSKSSSNVVAVLSRIGIVVGGFGKPNACGDLIASLVGLASPISGFSGRSLEERLKYRGSSNLGV